MKRLQEQIVPEVHAYLIEGWWESVIDAIEESVVAKIGDTAKILPVTQDTFGIDDVRRIIDLQTRRSNVPDVFILGCRTITREAQNALLKVAEEPTVNTYFFVVVPFSRVLVPTLRSRLFPLVHEGLVNSDDSFAKKFLSAHPDTRILLLENILKNKDKAGAHRLLDTLLVTIYEKLDTKEERVESDYAALEKIVEARSFLNSRGASLKLLLEHIAMVTPVITRT